MNLKETIDSIATISDVLLAIDLGVHEACDFESNCPKAIQLKILIQEAGITMAQILQGYATITSEPVIDRPVTIDSFIPIINNQIDGRVHLNILGQGVDINISPEIINQISGALSTRLRRVQETRVTIQEIADSLYRSYIQAIGRAKTTRTVAQVQFPIRELLSVKILSTKSERSGYLFYMEAVYEPQYLTDNGVRYELSPEDKAVVRKDNLFLRIEIGQNNNFVSVGLVKANDGMFNHYHGSSYDCWGTMRLPDHWDRTVRQLQQLYHERMGSLKTINFNSILSHHPDSMPSDLDLKRRARRMGVEGEMQPMDILANAARTVVTPDSQRLNRLPPYAVDIIAGLEQREQPTTGTGWGRRR